MSKVISRGPCPRPGCTTRYGFVRHDNGSGHCYSCDYHENFDPESEHTTRSTGGFMETQETVVKAASGTYEPIPDRNISAKTAQLYGVTTGHNGIRNYKYYHNNQLASVKQKDDKSDQYKYTIRGNHKDVALFGSNVFPPGSGPNLIITEGEDDALAAHEMTGQPAVSLVNGAGTAKAGLTSNMDYINSYKHIYICFDGDEPGRKATEEAVKLLPMHKVRVMDITSSDKKDACDYNKTEKDRSLFRKIYSEASYPKPKGLITGREAWESAINKPPIDSVCAWPWECVNHKTKGLRFGEVIMLTAQSGVGKSYVLNETLYKVLTDTKYNVGAIGQEENEVDFGKRLMSIKLDKPTHFKHVRDSIPDDEWKKAYAQLPLERLTGFYEVGSLDIDEILGMVQYMVEGLGCKFIFYDHISMAVADQRNLDERKALDKLSTKLKALAKKLDFCCVIVSHLNREGEVKGSANPEKVADTWIDLSRDLTTGSNVTQVTIRKNRFVGQTGPSGELFFDDTTYRLTERVQ